MMFQLALLLALWLLPCANARAEDVDAVRIGVLTDMSGSLAGSAGLGSVEAAQLAVEDMGNTVSQKPIIVINADFQNRGDLAQHISESWINKQGIDVVVDVPNGPIAGRLQDFFKEKKRLLLTSCPSSKRFRDESCHSNSLSWLYDRDTLTVNLIQALLDEKKHRWFIISSDDGYSRDLTKIAKKKIMDGGGELVGEAQFAKRMTGIEMILEQTETLKPDVIFLAFDRPDLLHVLAHWPNEKHDYVAPLAFSTLFVNDIYALNNRDVPPFYTISTFYWNQDAATRDWSTKFATRNRGAMPTDIQASVYSSVRHYLQSVRDTKINETPDILAHMKATPLDDPLFGASHIRADGLVAHHLHLLAFQKENTRNKPWDVFHIVRTISPQDVALPQEVSCANE